MIDSFESRTSRPDLVTIVRVETPGPPGPPGPAGAVGSASVYMQNTPSASWNIQHTLGRKPIVNVYDENNAMLLAEIIADNTSVTVIHSKPSLGSVVLV